MAWIKRNLYFTIGGVIALALMGVGAWFLYTQIALESDLAEKIKAQYGELTRLKNLNPHPGDDKTDNIKIAKEQQSTMREYVGKIRPFYKPIPSIPESTNKISNAEFAAQLRNTVALLRHNAANQSVVLNEDYYFTFLSQKKVMRFDAASLPLLAVQLGEIKAICDILFDAKINSLTGLRRESVSPDDTNPEDYLLTKTVSTKLADFSPYEASFQCFSKDLAQVLSALASSPYGFVVKTVNVEPASQGGEDNTGNPPGAGTPPMQPPPGSGIRREFVNRPPPSSPSTSTARANQVFYEKPLRITLLINIVKLKPAAK